MNFETRDENEWQTVFFPFCKGIELRVEFLSQIELRNICRVNIIYNGI